MEKLILPYLTATEATAFLFYQVPQALVDDEAFKGLDGWAIILYSLMLNRAGLSVKNSENFTDDNGRLYIIFTVDEVMKRCRCAKPFAVKIMRQLEDMGLIEKKRQGLGKPSLIYVKNFAYYNSNDEISGILSQKLSKVTSESNNGLPKKSLKVTSESNSGLPLKVSNSYGSNTNHTKNHNNHNNLSKNNSINQTRTDTIDINSIKSTVKDRINIENLQRRYPDKQKELQELYDIIIEVLFSKKKTFRIAKEDMPAETVKQAFAVLDESHIEYVLECLRKNTTEVKSTKAYLQTTLWNAGKTINNHYSLSAQKFLYDNLGIEL